MRIGYDAKRLFNNFTGLGNYSRTLVHDLAHYYPDNEYFLYSPKITVNHDTQTFASSPMYHYFIAPKFWPNALWRTYHIPKLAKKHELDVYHGLSHEIPVGIDQTNIKSIVTIHDLIYKSHPDQYAPLDRKVYDSKIKYALEHADKVIAISQSTKQEILKYFKVEEEKIEVVYQSCSGIFLQRKSAQAKEEVQSKYKLPSEYYLYIGSIVERKNLLGILKAILALPKDLQLPLVVVGNGRGEYRKKVDDFIAKHAMESSVHFIGPDFDDLPTIYQMSKLFLYPSVAEGFGIPVLEALLSQVPVITSNCSALPEVGGEGALKVDPTSVDGIRSSIIKVFSDDDKTTRNIEIGFKHALEFSGKNASDQLMGIYQNLLV